MRLIRLSNALRYLVLILVTAVTLHADDKPLRVGVIVPLTGNLSQMGESIRNGFIFWKERNPESSLEFLFEDDQFLPKQSATAAAKLITVDKVKALVTFTSGPGMAVAPIAQRAAVVHFCLTVDSRLANGDFNFVHLFQSRDAARRLLQKFQAENIRKVGIFRFIEDAAQLSAAELQKQASGYGVDILFDEAFPSGTTDFRSIILRAQKKDAEAVMVIALPPELEILARQLRELKFRPLLTSIEIFSISNEPKLFDGLWFAQPAFPNGAYVSFFKTRFHRGVGWGHYADNVATLLDAAIHTQGTASLKDALEGLKNVPSTVGPLSADSDGVFPVPVVIAIMKDGAPVLLER